jgi:hypothetical protein
MHQSWPVLGMLAFAALSGCAGNSGPIGEQVPTCDEATCTVPPDFSGNHTHNVWGTRQTLPIMDLTIPAFTTLTTSPAGVPFRLEPGNVVPLETKWVNLTVSWELDAGSLVGPLELWIKTQADTVSNSSQPYNLASPTTQLSIDTEPPKNDLPHQILSGWRFDVILYPDPGTGILKFNGKFRIVADATRGYPTPILPAHPDQWNGTDSIELLSVSMTGLWLGCLGTDACSQAVGLSGNAGPWVPGPGLLVPQGTSYVEAVIESAVPTPASIGLAFHGADSWSYERPTPTEDTLQRRTWRIDDAASRADGPYATSSLWEFQLYAEGPPEDGLAADEIQFRVVAYR